MKKIFLLAFAAVSTLSAQAVLFDFEEFSVTSNGALTSLQSTQGGITMDLTRTSGVGFDIVDLTLFDYPISWGDRAVSPFENADQDDYFVANFSVGLLAAEVEMTDFAADEDDLVIEAWSGLNGTGTLLASSSLNWGLGSTPNYAAVGVVANTAFQSIVFRGGGQDFPNSMFVDNISVEAVPEPATMAALALGLAAMARRRRKA